MSAFAFFKMPLDLSKREGAATVALSLVASYPGTRNVEVDSRTGVVSFELQFPGNLTGLVGQLRARQIYVGKRLDVKIPVRDIVPEKLAKEPYEMPKRLEEGTEVWDPQFFRGEYVYEARMIDDTLIEASIAPTTNALHQLYDSMLTLGIVANDEADVFQGSASAYRTVLGLV